MKTCSGSCESDCPVIRYLQTGETDKLSLHDGAAADDIARIATHNAEEIITETCSAGAPGKPLFAFGRLACQSALIRNHFTRPDNPLHAAESAIRMTEY